MTDPALLHRVAEHLTARWAGVASPERVHRSVAQAHATLASTARVRTRLAPIAVHAAGARLTALARSRGNLPAPVRRVLFVDAHDTGPAQIAAGLLAHHAGVAVVVSSAGIDPAAAVDPFAVEVLAQHGIEPSGLAPTPLAAGLLRAADWVITLGVHDALPGGSGAILQDWPVDPSLDEDRGPQLVAELDSRVQALWVEISASAACPPAAPDRAAGT